MYHLITFCILLATATVGVHGHLFQRWLTRGQLLAPWQPADADRDEALPASAVNAALSKMADNTGNNIMYFVETNRELFVSGNVPAPILKPGSVTNISAPTANISVSASSTNAPILSTSAPVTSTSAQDLSTSARITSTSAPNPSTSAAITSTSAPTTSTPFTAPPGYTYSSATGSYYKYHDEAVLWREANATCANEGGYLVILNDATEAAVVKELIRAADEWWTWTGVIDKRPQGVSDWRSIHGEPINLLYHKWASYRPSGRPDNIYAPMHAGEMHLVDHDDETRMEFTCEISQ